MAGVNGEKDEWYLALFPLPPILLFVVFLLINDKEYLTAQQQVTTLGVTVLACGVIYALMRILLRRSANLKRLFREHGPYILLLLLLILVKFKPEASNINYIWTESFGIHDYLLEKYSVIDYHQLPLWNPFIWSGSPSYAIGDRYYLYPLAVPSIFLPTVLALNLTTILNTAFAGILMYGLVYYLSKSKQAGFVSAFVFILSAWWMVKSQWLFFHITFPVALIPAIFFTLVMLTKQKKLSGFMKWGAATGIILGVQVLSGNPEYFLYTVYFILAIYLAVYFLTSARLKKKLPFLVIAGILMVGICISLSAVKLLPANKFMKITNRGGEWSGENHPSTLSDGSPLDIFGFLARSSWKQLGKWGLGKPSVPGQQQVYQNEEAGEIGLIGFLLALLAITKIRRRYVLALYISTLSVIIILLSFPAYNFLRATLPLLGRFHVASRALTVFIFAGAVLAGIGWTVLSEKIPKKWQKRAFFILVSLLILDLIILGNPTVPLQPGFVWLEDNHILQDLSEREGLFRISSFDVIGIDWAIHMVTLPLKIQYNQGLDGLLWMNDYMEYIQIAHSSRSRLWGMLNIKYVTSKELVDQPGFTFEQTFENCGSCDYPLGAIHFDGPHLYTNDNVLPRAYTVDNAILVTGDYQSAKNIIYGLMVHPSFNPRTTTIIHYPHKLSDMRPEIISQFSAIVPISLAESDWAILSAMKNSGIEILPDILSGESQITEAEMAALLYELNGNVTDIQEVEVSLFTPNKVMVEPVTQGAFLVLAEKYSMFEGEWKGFTTEGEVEILRANAIGSAIPVSDINGESVTFRFLPPVYIIGASLSLCGLIAGVILFWQPWMTKQEQEKPEKKKKKTKSKPSEK